MGGIGGTVYYSSSPYNGGTYTVYSGPVTGWTYGDGSAWNWSFNNTTATSELHASAAHDPSGDTTSFSYEVEDSDGTLVFSGSGDSGGINVSIDIDKVFPDGYFSFYASKNTHTPNPTNNLSINFGFENPDVVFSGGYSKSTGYMGSSSENWNFHLLGNIGTTGLMSFDTEKNSNGTSSRLYMSNQTGTLAGGLVARKENGGLAVGVAVATKNTSNTWDATFAGYTYSGAQTPTYAYGLTGSPLNLGNVNVTGINFTGNWSLQRSFFLINLNPSATLLFVPNSAPSYTFSIGGAGSW